MDNVDQSLRFVKFAMKYKDKKRTQIMIVTTCMDMTLKTLLKIIRARWDIENSIFNNLKTGCGLEHCFVHGWREGSRSSALFDIYCIKYNAIILSKTTEKPFYNLTEIVRLLLKGLNLLKYKVELVFSSS